MSELCPHCGTPTDTPRLALADEIWGRCSPCGAPMFKMLPEEEAEFMAEWEADALAAEVTRELVEAGTIDR